MKKLFLLTLVAAMLVACEEPIGDTSLIEGAWEQTTYESEGMVYADQMGKSHYSTEPYTQKFEKNERVWLFMNSSISWWSQFTEDGETFWGRYAGDASKTFAVEGSGKTMVIVETMKSIIPGMENRSVVTRYKVEKLTKDQMILTTTSTPFVSDSNATVNINEKYSFKRENTLIEFINKYINL